MINHSLHDEIQKKSGVAFPFDVRGNGKMKGEKKSSYFL